MQQFHRCLTSLFHEQLLDMKRKLPPAAFRACAEEVKSWSLADMDEGQKADSLEVARWLVQKLHSDEEQIFILHMANLSVSVAAAEDARPEEGPESGCIQSMR